MDKLQAMSVFVEIAERGSLTAAAGFLGKSLPTVVRTLARLEDRLNVRLFNRTTRRVALTEEGRLCLERCRKTLADIDEAELILGRHQGEPTGVITLTAPERFGEMHVAPAVLRFLERYPKIEVRLLESCLPLEPAAFHSCAHLSRLDGIGTARAFGIRVSLALQWLAGQRR
jgi:DNA-binding transcriptional LysR family regulator